MDIQDIINAIKANPMKEQCKVCEGCKEVQSDEWQAFFDKYGTSSHERDSKFSKAYDFMLKEGVKIYGYWNDSHRQLGIETLLKSNLLTEEEATDYMDLYLNAPDMVECENCYGTGQALSEHGKLVKELKYLLS